MNDDTREELNELVSDLKQFRSSNPNVFNSNSHLRRSLRLLEQIKKENE